MLTVRNFYFPVTLSLLLSKMNSFVLDHLSARRVIVQAFKTSLATRAQKMTVFGERNVPFGERGRHFVVMASVTAR